MMNNLEFWKMSGSGNDFILIDNRNGEIKQEKINHLVERMCRRRESVGADGVIFVKKSEKYDFAWQYLNADGGEVEMCGNGARCVSRFAYLKGIAGPVMTFETLAGPVSSEVNGRMVKVRMPRPSGLSLDLALKAVENAESIDFINTGVPHVVIQVENLDDHPVRKEGRKIRYHDMFSPKGTNADFMHVTGPAELHMRTYERGVEDETLACGTGAIACALIASERGLVHSPVKVRTRGGDDLLIHFAKKAETIEEVWLEGNTAIIYHGTLHDEAL